MREFIKMPNSETALVELLANESKLQNPYLDVGGVKVSTTLIGYNSEGSDIWVRLDRIGGMPSFPLPDRPVIQFMVYAPFKTVAQDVAQIVRGIVFAYSDENFGGLGCRGCLDYAGLMWLPDPALGDIAERYVFSLQLDVRPL